MRGSWCQPELANFPCLQRKEIQESIYFFIAFVYFFTACMGTAVFLFHVIILTQGLYALAYWGILPICDWILTHYDYSYI